MSSVYTRPARNTDIRAMYELRCLVHLTDTYLNAIDKHSKRRFMNRYTSSESYYTKHYASRIRKRIESPDWHVMVARNEQNMLIGFLAVYRDADTTTLKEIFVDPSVHGTGVGSKLLQKAFEGTKGTVNLHVLAKNTGAIKFYETHGFKKISAPAKTFFGAEVISMKSVD